jgi:Lysylphosphatidylglycerol synthase TM region
VLAYSTAGLVALLPLALGGLGIVEASMSGLLILADVNTTYAFLAALAYRIASYWLPLLAGPPTYLLFRLRYGRRSPGAPRRARAAGRQRAAKRSDRGPSGSYGSASIAPGNVTRADVTFPLAA